MADWVIHQGAGAGSEHPVDGELILGREQGSPDLVIDDPGFAPPSPVIADEDGRSSKTSLL